MFKFLFNNVQLSLYYSSKFSYYFIIKKKKFTAGLVIELSEKTISLVTNLFFFKW